MWDIRKSRSGVHQLGAYGPAMQPVLAVMSMRKALAAIPGLSAETHIPKPSLFQLLLDPLDDTRAGYTLGCGWQGDAKLSLQQGMHHAIQVCAEGMRHNLDWPGLLVPKMLQRVLCCTTQCADMTLPDTRQEACFLSTIASVRSGLMRRLHRSPAPGDHACLLPTSSHYQR